MKKLYPFVFCMMVALSVSVCAAQSIDNESFQSTQVLVQNGIVTASLQRDLIYTPLTRWEGAMLFSQYAELILGRNQDLSASCNFKDVTKTSIVASDILKSCQLGLLKGFQETFNPYGRMTRGQVIIVIARMLSEDPSLQLDAAYNYLLKNRIIAVDDRNNAARLPGRNEVYIMLARFLRAGGQDGNPLKQIVLVKTYIADPLLSGNFILQSQGSAVLLSPTTLLTNAHVVSDENGDPTGLYEICKIDLISKDPVCFSSAVLQRVDTSSDLAQLLLQQPYTQGEVTTFRTTSLKVGNRLTVVGFPYDGGTTITSTQGVVAGFDSDMVKTDAAVNYGNSGGGSYDDRGQLVGIPTQLNGNIGYLIPVSQIQSFLKDDDMLFVTTPSMQSISKSFLRFLPTQRNLILGQTDTLTTPNFSIADLQGFTLSNASYYTNDTIETASYVLTTSDKKTVISLNMSYVVGQRNIDTDVADLRDVLETNYTDITYEQKTYNGIAWHILTAKYDDAVYHFYLYEKDGGLFLATIAIPHAQDSVVSKAQKLVQSVVIKHIPSSSSSLSLGFVTLPLPSFATMGVGINSATHESAVNYNISLGVDTQGTLSIEKCGCSLAMYRSQGLVIGDLLNDDDRYYGDIYGQNTGTFVTIDGMQGYYIDSDDGETRDFRAVIKVIDPQHTDEVLSVVFDAEGQSLTDEHIAQFKNYVKTIRINGTSPFLP